jgi:ADP-heptose:LPS heptosyltransferase
MDTEYMDKLIRTNPALGKCIFFICVNINAGELCLHRRWPKEYFAKIIEELIKKPDIAILLIGAKADIGYVSEFKKSLSLSPRLVNICGQTNPIRELTGMLKKCDLLVTNDSGLLHLAYTIGLDTISFFGPETPYLYGPLDNKHCVLYEDLYCSPCLNIYNSKTTHCKKNMCLISIKPETVLKMLEDKYLISKKNRVAKNRVV